ncbi:MAG: alpha-xylosidase, partial [Prevotella sp.]|nr:alpha-xylosidase [Prevotella sp.]
MIKRKYLMLLLASILSLQTTFSNPIVIGNSRFTFLTENLVRMEYALNGQFLDDPTLFAINRTAEYTNVKVEDNGRNLYTITTPTMRVEYFNDGFPFGQTNLAVYFNDGTSEKDKRWYIASRQQKNLKGAITTLDDVSRPVPRQEGLLSRDGWYLINDTGKEIVKNDWVAPRNKDHIQDLYLFVYGNDYKSALKSLQVVSGRAPMPRKYVHGSWYCRWWNYTDDDYRQIVNEYKEHDFPLDIMVFDMGWHTQDAKVGTGHAGTRGWTGYSWNRKLIPDPAKLIDDFKKDNIYVVLNEHPHDGLRPHEDMYAAFIKD